MLDNKTGEPYFIYLDSKIVGTAKQIVTFFENEIFNKENTTVLIKKYKHKSSHLILDIFRASKIRCRFISNNEIDKLENGVVFYPFNAQSNCRVVANRLLTHIFITHGESNKVSSVKPIIRIYDYVATAGKSGIERYLQYKIFSEYDVDNGRIIQMGNTFIGKTGLAESNQNNKPENVIFYAPTWEGGIEQENYSSLNHIEQVKSFIIRISEKYNLNKILIKSHPNTGYRDKQYKKNLIHLAKALISYNLQVEIFQPYIDLDFINIAILKIKGIKFSTTLDKYNAQIGICDISAIETQFLNENIPYYILVNSKTEKVLNDSGYKQYYPDCIINLEESNKIPILSQSSFLKLKEFVISNSVDNIKKSDRIDFFIQNIKHKDLK